MTKQKSMLVPVLEGEIAAIELEKKKIEHQIKQLDKAHTRKPLRKFQAIVSH